MFSEEVDVRDLVSPESFEVLVELTRARFSFWERMEDWKDFARALRFEKHRLTPQILEAWLIGEGWEELQAAQQASDVSEILRDG
jgi:hypothetical protein